MTKNDTNHVNKIISLIRLVILPKEKRELAKGKDERVTGKRKAVILFERISQICGYRINSFIDDLKSYLQEVRFRSKKVSFAISGLIVKEAG